MSTIFTMAGKVGDALLQYPVAYHWAKERDRKFTLWLDEGSLKPLVPLFQSQACVEAVELKPGIENYSCGGQPYHFNIKTEDIVGHTVYHLGFRQFPQRPITLQTALDVFPQMDTSELAKPSIFVEPIPPTNRLVLHGTFTTHQSGVPAFWRWLRDNRQLLKETFDEIIFTGKPDERARALELYPEWTDFDDVGSFLELAKLMAGARLVVGCGSSGVVLAGVLGVPAVRVHDPIGDLPRAIWSNLGDNQLNDTEIGLRRSFPEFLSTWHTPKDNQWVETYSQFGEHIDIDEAVAELNGTGYAVDVGAANGVSCSNTKHLEDRGWNVLCIEPNPLYEQDLRANRKHVAMVACGRENAEAQDFQVFEVTPGNYEAVSSLKPDPNRPVHQDAVPKQTFQVPVRTLDTLLEEAQFPRLDVLSIDVEGTEPDVLEGFSIKRWAPKVVVLEDWQGGRYVEQMAENGYYLKRRRGVNDIYVHE